jgi:hypothetical protein
MAFIIIEFHMPLLQACNVNTAAIMLIDGTCILLTFHAFNRIHRNLVLSIIDQISFLY